MVISVIMLPALCCFFLLIYNLAFFCVIHAFTMLRSLMFKAVGIKVLALYMLIPKAAD